MPEMAREAAGSARGPAQNWRYWRRHVYNWRRRGAEWRHWTRRRSKRRRSRWWHLEGTRIRSMRPPGAVDAPQRRAAAEAWTWSLAIITRAAAARGATLGEISFAPPVPLLASKDAIPLRQALRNSQRASAAMTAPGASGDNDAACSNNNAVSPPPPPFVSLPTSPIALCKTTATEEYHLVKISWATCCQASTNNHCARADKTHALYDAAKTSATRMEFPKTGERAPRLKLLALIALMLLMLFIF
mmetsp:Transcript_14925/g.26375  ORF Transcript_14925/g.26375 Transcript_14925/m.26375 type:complete len:245 (+) Transcript_14925:1067-1801(+)